MFQVLEFAGLDYEYCVKESVLEIDALDYVEVQYTDAEQFDLNVLIIEVQ